MIVLCENMETDQSRQSLDWLAASVFPPSPYIIFIVIAIVIVIVIVNVNVKVIVIVIINVITIIISTMFLLCKDTLTRMHFKKINLNAARWWLAVTQLIGLNVSRTRPDQASRGLDLIFPDIFIIINPVSHHRHYDDVRMVILMHLWMTIGKGAVVHSVLCNFHYFLSVLIFSSSSIS